MRIRLAVFGLVAAHASAQFLTERWNANSETYLVTINSAAVSIGAVTTGAAFSAEVIWQQVRTLADGTRMGWPPTISREWRDAEGRSRSETGKPGELKQGQSGRYILTEIWDPVGRIIYILDDETKTAYRFPAAARQRQAAPAKAEPAPGEKLAVMVTEKLGTRNMEGVMAEGVRKTKTVPADAIGNDRPLVTTSEEWYSPEIKRQIYSSTSDPRNGDRLVRTINISRAAPDPALFQPPAGYSIVEGKGSISIVLKRQ
jgi:hypothetical protein